MLCEPKEVKSLKLMSIPVPFLGHLLYSAGVSVQGKTQELIKRGVEKLQDKVIDDFIKKTYQIKILERRKLISDDDLKQELLKVKDFSWGVIQGELDQKIQREYVRQIPRYDDLVEKVKVKLHDEITSYVVCTWYNHWTTVLIEEHIAQHPKVLPTLKNIKGIDIFFDGQPFDLKVTYLPRGYDVQEAIKDPKQLAIWMYENQGAQRFGADNRLFVVLLDAKNPDKSWELKRDFDFVFKKIDDFFAKESVSDKDEITFTFGGKNYKTHPKILIICK